MSKKVFTKELKLKIRQSLVFMTLFLSVVWIIHDYALYTRNVTNLRKYLVDKAKTDALEKIREVKVYIQYQKTNTEKRQRDELVTRINEAHSYILNLYRKYKDKMSEHELKQMITSNLQSASWNDGQGYYFAINMSGISQLHPIDYQGKDILEQQDSKGNYFVKKMIDLIRKDREGFIKYYWKNLQGSRTDTEKLSYIKYFEPFDWFIGTGSYINDESSYLQQTVLKQFNYISDLHKHELLYLFRGDGPVIFSSTFPELVGKNFSDIKDSDNHHFMTSLKENADLNTRDFIEYNWINPSTSRTSKKLCIARKFDDWDWYIVSGFYMDEIEEKINEQLKFIKLASLIKMLLSMFVFIILAFIFSKISNLMIVKTINDFSVFSHFIKNHDRMGKRIDTSEIQYAEFVELAEDVNLMIQKREEAEGQITSYKDDLELLVESRTKELVDLNSQLNKENLERLNTTKELNTQKHQLEVIIQSSPSIIFGVSPFGEITFVNPAGEQIIGYTSDDVRKMDWKKVFLPDYRIRFPQDFLSENEFNFYDHVSLTTKTGEKRSVIYNIRKLFDKEKQLQEILFFGNDVTEILKAKNDLATSKRYIQSIIDSMPSGIVSVNSNCIITLWNTEISINTGISAEEAEGKNINTVLPWLKAIDKTVEKAILLRSIQEESKVPYANLDSTYILNITVYPLISENENGAVIKIDDITDKIRMEEMMMQSEKMLSIGGLAAGMAHEINNPLAGMIQNADVLHNRLTSGLKKNYRIAEEIGIDFKLILEYMEKRKILHLLSNIKKSGLIAARIVDNMLSFARDNKTRSQKENIAVLLDKTIDLASNDYNMRKKYDFKKIKIHREYSADIPEVNCEGSKIQQVILNLLRNSAHALMLSDISKQRTPEIFIRVFAETDNIRIEVEDNGPGISEKHQKRIFEPFFTLKTVGEGTGLGLSVSYFIITENHKGTMYVESIPNAYTKFVITLPYN